MATDPEPIWARDEAQRDWHLEHTVKRRRDDYVYDEVPSPVEVAVHREIARFKRVRAELYTQRRMGLIS
ncbi:hypothetical protein [Amycolatopsis sp. NPDC050768]|uniref:hypothetical protein n=1 Tax=Amycolatopsis sp. NPDC050768 TaxID=3154839 RepID=UPI0033C7E8D2